MNEGDYLEAMNQLKDKFQENDKKVKNLIEQNIQLKKDLMTCYGMVRMLDMNQPFSLDSEECSFFISQLRSFLSHVIETEILVVNDSISS